MYHFCVGFGWYFDVLQVLDVTGDGQVTSDDVKGRYDASQHPDVILGVKSTEQVRQYAWKNMRQCFLPASGSVSIGISIQ